MSVVGFDIGNLNCYIAIARQGGIEVITNDYSLHATPACVAFGARNRTMGVAARQAVNTNFKSTIINFKHLIGRKYSDAITQKFIKYIPCSVVQLPNDEIGLKVNYMGQEATFTPEQVLAALLTKLREVIEFQVNDVKKVSDCVVAVPGYFTDVQRRAVTAATQYAGVNAMRIMNESTAVALAYGIYKQDLPEDAEGVNARNVLFLDVGHASTQASIVAYKKGKLQMLNSEYDLDVGGLWFDILIAEHFRNEIKKKYGVDARESPRAWLRLLDESERVKKQMSANQTPIPLNIECFMNDKDVTSKMQRAEFEELAAHLFDKMQQMLRRLLENAGLKASDVDEIEIVGGSSRIPMIKKIIIDMFGKEPRTTMNQDEAVARGAAMQCAILSPAFRVREFSVKDAQPFGISITWQGGAAEGGESEAFKERDEFPFSKVITLYRENEFQVDARYTSPNVVPHNTVNIGSWRVSGVTPKPNGDKSKVKVKVRVNANGVFSVCSATMSESKPVESEAPAEPMETDQGSQDVPAVPPTEEKEKKPKTKSVLIELPIVETVPVSYDVQKFQSMEVQMQEDDHKEKKKADSKNSVEEYVYEMREKLSDQYSDYITEQDADEFRSELTATEDWLYDEGEEAEISVYEKRLAELKHRGDPVVERFREAETRKPAFDAFDQAIMRTRKAYDDYVNRGAAHAHIESKDMEKVINAIEEKKRWLDEARHKQDNRPKTESPVVFTHEIIQAHQAFDNVVRPILNKPKPKPKAEAPPPNPAPAASTTEEEKAAAPKPAEMDVDID